MPALPDVTGMNKDATEKLWRDIEAYRSRIRNAAGKSLIKYGDWVGREKCVERALKRIYRYQRRGTPARLGHAKEHGAPHAFCEYYDKKDRRWKVDDFGGKGFVAEDYSGYSDIRRSYPLYFGTHEEEPYKEAFKREEREQNERIEAQIRARMARRDDNTAVGSGDDVAG